jgi:hypothetical protein
MDNDRDIKFDIVGKKGEREEREETWLLSNHKLT